MTTSTPVRIVGCDEHGPSDPVRIVNWQDVAQLDDFVGANTIIRELSNNIVETDFNLSYSTPLVAGVRQVVINWDDNRVILGNVIYDVPAGSIILNTADVVNPTTYYIYVRAVAGVAVVVSSSTSPEIDPAVNYEYAWLSIARIKSNAGAAIIYFIRNAFTELSLFLHYIGEWDLYNAPIWVTGGGLSINATTGVVDMVDELEYRRLRFDREIPAITAGTLLIEDESIAYANLELITTYSDGSPITAGKYHKVLIGVPTSLATTYDFIIVRQGKPNTEYATLDEARIDAENVAATSFPLAYRGGVFPIAYIVMLLGDASDLTTIDLRATGVTGSGGGGGTPIADHSLLINLGADDHLQYLRTDGARTLTGNMAVDPGITIDTVDISAHAANANAHHNAITLNAAADTLLGLSTQQITLDTQTANQVLAGPTTGAPATPTFRALVGADLPSNASIMPYAMASDSTTQSITNTANAQLVSFNTSELLSGITRTSATRYTIITPGTYRIFLSAIANLAALPGNKHLEIWMRVNGVDVPRSNTRVELVNASVEMTVAVELLYTFTAGQYFEIWTWGDDTDCQWLATAAGAAPTRPAVPSIIMTVNMVSSN